MVGVRPWTGISGESKACIFNFALIVRIILLSRIHVSLSVYT